MGSSGEDLSNTYFQDGLTGCDSCGRMVDQHKVRKINQHMSEYTCFNGIDRALELLRGCDQIESVA